MAGYKRILNTAASGIQATGAFTDLEQLRFDWERTYTTDEWVDQVPTLGGHSTLPPERLDQLIAAIRAAIENLGGTFNMSYAALAITARRRRDQMESPSPSAP